MNDENDHDQGTEHIEKGILDKLKKKDQIANADSATETNSDTADGEVGGTETIKPVPTEGGKGGKSQKKQGGFFQGIKDDRDYKDYEDLTKDDWYQGGNDHYNRDEVDEETGAPRWKAHYEELKRNKAERDAFAEEYRKHTGRDFNAKDPRNRGASWFYYSDAYGPQGNMRGEDGEIDWDRVNRGIAQTYLENYAQGEWNDEELSWKNPEKYATFNYDNEDLDRFEDMLRNDYGVTDEQIQEAYKQVRETGQVDPALFRGPSTSEEEAEQAAEEIEQQVHNNGEGEGGAVVPGGTGKGEDGGKGGKRGLIEEENPDILSERNGSVMGDGAKGRQQTEWKPSVTSQRMMDAGLAGLNMFGGIMGGANKAFSMLRGLASALTSRQLMSDPTLPARGFLNAMEQSGQIVEDHIRQVGEAYGIKDGVKRDDLVGTYKGAQYYREKQQIENAEKQYYAGVGNALSAVLGNNVDVNDTVGIQNALAQMTPQQLSQLDDALFGQNGSLKDMYEATVVNPMGSTREQKARAQLLTTLNQSLKGQAQANAREAGRQRTQANQQIQQANQQSRQIRMDQEADKAEAIRRMTSPDMMPQSNADQMATVFNAILGDEVRNKKIRVRTWGNNTWVDPKDLNSTQLKALKRGMEDHPELLTDPRTRGVRALYDEVNARLGDIDQFKQDEAQAKIDTELDPIKNSPLDMDMRGPEVRRDEYGIPETTGRRNQLRDSAREMKARLENEGGSADDIALCDNIILMCDMAEMRQNVFSDVQKMESNGIISPMDAEMIRSEARAAYRDLAGDLALSVAERDRMAQAGDDWRSTGRYEVTAHQMNMRGAKEYSDSIQAEYKQGLKDARDAERQERKRQEEIDKAARKARMTEQEKQDAQFDGRGIPLCPDNGPRDKCRKSLNASLTQVEIMLENIPDTPENAYRRSALAVAKHETEKQLMRLDQEDHLQKMIQDARRQGKGDEATAKAKGLRDRYYDWEEFGKALNDIRENELGLNSDRAWRSTKARQREARAQARQDAIVSHMENIEQLLGGIKTGVEETRDWQGTINNNLYFLKNEMVNDFKDYLDGKFHGQAISRGVQRAEFQKWFEKYFENTVKGEFDRSLQNAVSTITDKMQDNTDGLIQSVSDLDVNLQKQLDGVDKTMREKADALSSALSDYYTGNKQSRKAHADRVIQAIGEYGDAVKEIREKVNGMSTIGGSFTDKAELNLTEEQKEKLDRTLTALESVSSNLQKFIDNNGGDAKNIDPEALATAVLAAYQSMEQAKGDADAPALESNDDDEKLKTLKRMLEILEKHDKLYEEFNANREVKAYPVKLVDDAYSMVEQDLAQQDQNDPSGDVLDNARNDASETGQETVPEATEPEGGEIYGEGEHGEAILTPEEEQKLNEAEQSQEKPISEMTHEELNQYLEDKYSELFTQSESLTEKMRELRAVNPLLFRHVMDNPDELLDMYVAEASMNDEGGPTLHQSYKNLLQNAQVYRAFGDDDATNERVVEQMVNDMLGAPDRDDAEKTRLKWLGDNPSEARAATVNNASAMANRFLDKVFTANAKRKHDAELADATQKGLNAEAIRDYFKYLHKEAKPTQAELKAAKRAAANELKRQKEEEEARKVRESHVEPTAQKLGMDLTTENGKAAFDIIYDNLISKGRDALYDISNRPNVKQDYRNTLQALRDLKTAEGDEAFNKIMGSIIPSMFREAGVVQGNNITDASAGFDSRAAQIGLELGRAGKVPKGKRGAANNEMRDPKEFSIDSLYDAWLKGDHNASTNGHLTKNALIDAYALGKQVVAREKKVASYYDPVMSGALFKDQITKLNGALDEMDKVDSWDDLNARFKNNKTGNERYNAYKNARDTLDKHITVAKENLDYLKGLRARVTNGFYEEADKLGVTIPPEKIKEMTDTLSRELAVIDKMSERYSAKLQDFNHLKNSLSHISEKTAQELAEEERANAQNNADGASGQPKSGADSQEAYDKRSNKATSALSSLRDELIGSENVQSAMNSIQRRSKETDEQFQLRQMFVGLNTLFKEKGDDAGEFLNKLAVDLGLRKNTKKDRWSTMNEPQVKRLANAILYGSGKLTDRKYDGVWPPKEESKQEESTGKGIVDKNTSGDDLFSEEEDATEYVDDSQLTDGLDPNVIFD